MGNHFIFLALGWTIAEVFIRHNNGCIFIFIMLVGASIIEIIRFIKKR
jgi:hypothetical protein